MTHFHIVDNKVELLDQDHDEDLKFKSPSEGRPPRWPPRWPPRRPGVVYTLGLLLGVALVAGGAGMFAALDPFIRAQISSKVVISPSSVTYPIWQDIPVPVYMQFWLFNVTNTPEVLRGGKPHVVQMGPFTYRERREKFNITWNDNGTVTYRQNRTFHFVPEMSNGTETTNVTTVNPLIPVLSQGIKLMSTLTRYFVATALGYGFEGKEDLFMTRPVEELLWGYDDPALEMLKGLLPSAFDVSNIGYFIRRNYTDDGLYTVFTGENNISNIGQISRFNGKESVDIWTTPYANMINGSDGSLGPPLRFDDTYSPVFVSDICRSIRGVYLEDIEVKGIRLRRFGGDRNDMENATVNPDNYGFCTENQCLPSGLLNSTLCQEPIDGFNLPVVFSFPHFLHADPAVQQSISGLSPNEEEHQTVIDVEPWTGMALQAAKRLQINIFVEKDPNMHQTGNVSTLFFPILWLNESSVTDEERADLLNDMLFTPKKVAEKGRVVAIAVGCVLLLVCSMLMIWNRCVSKRERGDVSTSTWQDKANSSVFVGKQENAVEMTLLER